MEYEGHDGVSPSYDEMMRGMGLRSKSNIGRWLDDLAERGFIRRLEGKHRAIEIVRKGER